MLFTNRKCSHFPFPSFLQQTLQQIILHSKYLSIQRNQLFLHPPLRKRAHIKVIRSHFRQPFPLHLGHSSQIIPRRFHQLVIHNPLRTPRYGGRWMNACCLYMVCYSDFHLIVLCSAVISIAIEHGGLHEKASTEASLDVYFSLIDRKKLRRRNGKMQPLEERAELLANVGCLQERT